MNEDKNIKTPRASQSRVSDKRPTTWTPPSSLDAPPAPDGFRHRWIRTETLGMDDTKNMSGKLRSGWELVRADQYPEHPYPQVAEGKYAGVIGVGALCWQGYQKRSQNLVKLILENKFQIEMKQ